MMQNFELMWNEHLWNATAAKQKFDLNAPNAPLLH